MRRADALDLPWLTPPARREGPAYEGRRLATARGLARELIELVEVG